MRRKAFSMAVLPIHPTSFGKFFFGSRGNECLCWGTGQSYSGLVGNLLAKFYLDPILISQVSEECNLKRHKVGSAVFEMIMDGMSSSSGSIWNGLYLRALYCDNLHGKKIEPRGIQSVYKTNTWRPRELLIRLAYMIKINILFLLKESTHLHK